MANQADGRTMSLQYFDTLKSLGESPSTKWIFPMEFTSMLGNFMSMGGNALEAMGTATGRRTEPTKSQSRLRGIAHEGRA